MQLRLVGVLLAGWVTGQFSEDTDTELESAKPSPIVRRFIAIFLLVSCLGLAVMNYFVEPPEGSKEIVIFVLGQFFAMAATSVIWYFHKGDE